jgi:hypothetical protein
MIAAALAGLGEEAALAVGKALALAGAAVGDPPQLARSSVAANSKRRMSIQRTGGRLVTRLTNPAASNRTTKGRKRDREDRTSPISFVT